MKKFNKQKYMRNEIANGYLIILAFLMVFIPDPIFMTAVVSVTVGFIFIWIREIQFNKDFKNPLNEVHRTLAQRYIYLMKDNCSSELHPYNEKLYPIQDEVDKVYNMLYKIDKEANNWPPDKSSRWLGYCQRYLIEKEVTTVQKERDFSRSLFHKAYIELGYDVPESVTIK